MKKKEINLEGFLFLCVHFAAILIQLASAIMTFVVKLIEGISFFNASTARSCINF